MKADSGWKPSYAKKVSPRREYLVSVDKVQECAKILGIRGEFSGFSVSETYGKCTVKVWSSK